MTSGAMAMVKLTLPIVSSPHADFGLVRLNDERCEKTKAQVHSELGSYLTPLGIGTYLLASLLATLPHVGYACAYEEDTRTKSTECAVGMCGAQSHAEDRETRVLSQRKRGLNLAGKGRTSHTSTFMQQRRRQLSVVSSPLSDLSCQLTAVRWQLADGSCELSVHPAAPPSGQPSHLPLCKIKFVCLLCV